MPRIQAATSLTTLSRLTPTQNLLDEIIRLLRDSAFIRHQEKSGNRRTAQPNMRYPQIFLLRRRKGFAVFLAARGSHVETLIRANLVTNLPILLLGNNSFFH